MDKRIKELRKELGLTQQKFADRLGIKQNTVAQYEIGRNEPVDTVINLIVKEFSVSETWLRTGEGEMFIRPEAFTLDDYARANGLTSIEAKIIRAYMELPRETRRELVDSFKRAILDDDIDEKVNSYRRELVDQKRDVDASSVSPNEKEA